MAERKAGNWLHGFNLYTQESEAPDRFILWAGMSAVAAATQRQVYIKWAYRKWYTNLYVMLVGPTGSRKTTAMLFAKDILQSCNIAMSSESLSKEALIEQMVERNKLKIPKRSALTVFVSEFMTFYQISGPAMIEFLTDIWDSPDKWEYATKKRGVERIQNAFLNMLGATTPSWIAETFTASFVDHGFVGRNLFICEDGPRFRKARPKVTKEMEEMYLALIEDLTHLTKVQGEFQWSKEAEKYFDHYYEQEYPKEKIDYRLSGYLERKPTHLLKVAMVLALTERDDLILREKDLTTAKMLLEDLEPRMLKAFSAVGKNPYASDLERILHDIILEGGITDQELRKRNFHAMEKMKLDEQLENLKLMGLIRASMKNGRLCWVATGDGMK